MLTPLAGAPAAAAVPVSWAPWITCDATTGTITTGLHHGDLVPGRKVVATFTVYTGQTITATAHGSLPQYGSTTVTGTVGADYQLDLAGYTRAWDPAPYLYYEETVRVVLQYADGGATIWTGSTATCRYDPRNSYSFTCGGAGTPTFAVSVTGTRATAASTDPLDYPSHVTYRQYIDEDTGSGFVAHYQAADVDNRIVRTGDTWADAGITRDLSRHLSFVSRLEITVTNAFGWVVGGAQYVCDYTAPPAA
jgi:hypothetical protein